MAKEKRKGKTGALLANVGYIAGGAALAGAVALFFLEAPGEAPASGRAFHLAPSGAGLVLAIDLP